MLSEEDLNRMRFLTIPGEYPRLSIQCNTVLAIYRATVMAMMRRKEFKEAKRAKQLLYYCLN